MAPAAAWADIPTWLLVVLAGAAGWVGFAQLSALRLQIAEDIRRNVKRDRLMDKQIEEAEGENSPIGAGSSKTSK